METQEKNYKQAVKEFVTYIISLLISSGGLVTAVKSIGVLRIAAIIVTLLGLGWLLYLILRTPKRKKLKRRALPPDEEGRLTGFNEALSYTYNDAHRFYGRSNNIFDIINKIDRDGYKLGVLHGESGVGKTSIIQAGLLPELEKRNAQWGYISLNRLTKAVNTAPLLEEFLVTELNKRFGFDDCQSLEEMAAKLATSEKEAFTVLFLDQFEQVFDHLDEEARLEFAQYLEQLCKQNDNLKIVVSVRQDYFGQVYQMFENLERASVSLLSKFNGVQAREVIRQSAGYGKNLETTRPDDPLLAFEDEIMDDLKDTDGRIHPVELSIICAIMMKENSKLDRQSYISGGKKKGWLNRYLEDVMTGQPHKNGPQLLNSLIDGDKAPFLTVKDISERSGLKMNETLDLLDYFHKCRVVVESVEENEKKYRLAHEYLISAIRLKSGDVETPVQKYSRLLETRLQMWESENHNSHHLLRGIDLFKIRFKLKDHLGWESNTGKRIFVQKSLRRVATIVLIFFLSAAAVLTAGRFTWQHIDEKSRFDNYLTALKGRSDYDLHKIEKELEDLSRELISFKLKILSTILTDNSKIYGTDIMSVLYHTLIGISKKNRDKVVKLAYTHLNAANVAKIIPIVSKENLDLQNQKRFQEKLLKLLRENQDDSIAATIVRGLGPIGDQEVVRPLIDFIENVASRKSKAATAYALGEIGDKRAIMPLLNLLKDSDYDDIRNASTIALKKVGDKSAIQPLINIIRTNNNVWIKNAAADVLGKLGDKQTSLTLINLLKNSVEEYIKSAAAIALGSIGDRGAVLPLIDLLDVKTYQIASGHAVEALGKIGDKRAVPSLITFLKNCINDDYKKTAMIALGKIRDKRAVPVLVNLLNNTTDYDDKLSAIKILGEIGDKSAVQPLIDFENNTSSDSLKIHAELALGNIYKKKAISLMPLYRISGQTSPTTLRKIRALIQINPSISGIKSKLETFYKQEKNFKIKFEILMLMKTVAPLNREYLEKMINEILRHPFAIKRTFVMRDGSYERVWQTIKSIIIKHMGEVAGKDFEGNMWKMLDWWEEYKKQD